MVNARHGNVLAPGLDPSRSRRTALWQGVAMLSALGAGLMSRDVEAKKRRRKKRKKDRHSPTCTEQCGGGEFNFCIERADAPLLCGVGYGHTCMPCRTDQDCIQSVHPYCATRRTYLPTGRTDAFEECGNHPVGICAQVEREVP